MKPADSATAITQPCLALPMWAAQADAAAHPDVPPQVARLGYLVIQGVVVGKL